MKPKVFLAVVAVLILTLSVSAPSLKLAESFGWIELPKMGNIIEPDRIYGDGTEGILNAIERAKADVTDTYINCLPGYAQIVTALQTAEMNFNSPFNELLSSSLSKPIKPDPNAAPVSVSASEAEAEAGSDAASETAELSAETAETPADTVDTAETLETADPQKPAVASVDSRFLRSSGEGINFYAVDVTYDDGSAVGLITSAFNTPEKTYARRMQKTAEQVNAIAAANTDVNVFFYICSRLQDSECFPEIVPGEPSLAPLVEEFRGLLDPRIKVDRLKIDSLQDSIDKLFLTDHHWNAAGMYEAYTDIVRLIYGDEADSVLRPLGTRYDIEDADFYGTFARTSGYYDYHDDFFFFDYGLPEHELVADNPYDFKKVMKKYTSGQFSKDISADHYVNFYPYSQYLKFPENHTGHVLLLLGDSYSRGISELLSSSFDEAYIFDYRRISQIGNYNDFIEKHGITDVLFMQYSLRGIFDNQGDNTLDTIGLD